LRPSTEDQLKELIEVFNARGASLHIRDKYHYTAFMVAVDEHCNVILSFLLDDLQFDIREKDMIDRPVFAIAILTDNSYAIDLLIKRGINPNEKIKIKWNCYITKEMLPLQLAINHIKKNSTKQLLQSGVSIEKNKKFDPVFDATSKKCLEIVRDLLAKGASSKTVVKGLTPYLNALYLGQSDIANLLEKHEEGFSEHFIQMKMLDLRFGLGATIRLSEHDIKSSGLVHSLGQKRIFPMFVNSLTQFLSSLSLSFWNDEKTKQLVSAFMHAPNYDLRNLLPYEQDPILQAWKRDELIAASAGWGNHHACMAIYGNLLAKANRGSGCGDFPGAVVYKMKKPLSSEALCALFSQKDSTGFTKKIDKLLELEQVAYLPLPEQDKSNCPWASTEALLLASIFLSLYEENSGKPLEEYIDQSKQLFDLWLKFDHTFGITHYLNFAPHNSTPPDLIFLAKVLAVYQEKDVVRDQLFDFLVQKNVDWNAQDSNGNSALHAAALKNHPEFIVFLKSKKINLNVNLQNSKGETPLHIACQKGYLPMIKMLIENGY
jgi:ankyrin repeat protein